MTVWFNRLLPDTTLANMRETKLALKGPLTTPVGSGFRSVNVRLREALQLYANVRPGLSLIPDGRFTDVDVVLIRENTGGFYLGVEHFIPIGDEPRAVAEASGFLTRENCTRIAKFAFEYALRNNRRKVTGLFLETVTNVSAAYAGQVELEERIVDNCAMQLVLNPSQFDIILTTNMFGDILSDEIAGIIGGLGLAPGANIGEDAAMFDAVHGSAPDIAGQGIANPTALLLAAAMMFDHCKLSDMGNRLRRAITQTLHSPSTRTRDLGGKLSTTDFASAVIDRL